MKYLFICLVTYLASFCQRQEIPFSDEEKIIFENAEYMCEKHHLSISGWGRGREVRASLDLSSFSHLTEEQAREIILEGSTDLIYRWNKKLESPIEFGQIIYHVSLSYKAAEPKGSVNAVLTDGTLGYFHSGWSSAIKALYKQEEISSEELESLMKACEARLDKESIS